MEIPNHSTGQAFSRLRVSTLTAGPKLARLPRQHSWSWM